MSDQVSLVCYEDQEIYLLGSDGMSDTGELSAYDCDFFSSLKEHLTLISPMTEPSLIALHGVLTSARSIPAEIPDVSVWIILQDSNDLDDGCVIEASPEGGPDVIAKEIEALLENQDCPVDNLTIDDIFLLYGYELNLGYGVNEEEIDDERLKECKYMVE